MNWPIIVSVATISSILAWYALADDFRDDFFKVLKFVYIAALFSLCAFLVIGSLIQAFESDVSVAKPKECQLISAQIVGQIVYETFKCEDGSLYLKRQDVYQASPSPVHKRQN